MHTGKTLIAQRMDFLPWTTFGRIVTRYGSYHRVRTLPCTEHFRILAFAQLTYRESLQDIDACLSMQAAKLYLMGIHSPLRRATLADPNEDRDWRNFRKYRDFERFFALHKADAFFVTRVESNADFRRISMAPSKRASGAICYRAIALPGCYTQ